MREEGGIVKPKRVLVKKDSRCSICKGTGKLFVGDSYHRGAVIHCPHCYGGFAVGFE